MPSRVAVPPCSLNTAPPSPWQALQPGLGLGLEGSLASHSPVLPSKALPRLPA